MKKFIQKHILTLIGVTVGALAGYIYWDQVGCLGSCAITSSPTNSVIYGSFMGGLLLSSFKKEKK